MEGKTRKTWRQGKSTCLTIPEWMLDQIEVQPGQRVVLQCYPGQFITVAKLDKGGESATDTN